MKKLAMGLVARDDGWRMPDVLWAKIEPLLPLGKAHPLGCHNPRVPNGRTRSPRARTQEARDP